MDCGGECCGGSVLQGRPTACFFRSTLIAAACFFFVWPRCARGALTQSAPARRATLPALPDVHRWSQERG